MIDAIELPPGAAETVREQFRRPSIFARPCPDAIARVRQRMAQLLALSDVEKAAELGRWVCAKAPGEPRYQLDLARVLTLGGKSGEAAAIYRELADNAAEMSSVIRARALFGLAHLAARLGDWPEVMSLLDRAAAMPLPDGEKRLATVQRFVAGYDGPAGDALRAYFWGHDPAESADALVLFARAARAARNEPGLGLGHYLVGRNLTRRGAPGDAARAIARSLDLPTQNPLVRREAARMLAEAGYLAGERALVESAAAILSEPEQTEVTRLYGADWLERLAWKEAWARDGAP